MDSPTTWPGRHAECNFSVLCISQNLLKNTACLVPMRWGDPWEVSVALYQEIGREATSTVRMGWISHRKWKETKQQPNMLPGPAVLGCCLVSFHFLWVIHPIRPVDSRSESASHLRPKIDNHDVSIFPRCCPTNLPHNHKSTTVERARRILCSVTYHYPVGIEHRRLQPRGAAPKSSSCTGR